MDMVSGTCNNAVRTLRKVFECCVKIFIRQSTALLVAGFQNECRALYFCQGPVDIESGHQTVVIGHTQYIGVELSQPGRQSGILAGDCIRSGDRQAFA